VLAAASYACIVLCAVMKGGCAAVAAGRRRRANSR